MRFLLEPEGQADFDVLPLRVKARVILVVRIQHRSNVYED
jgi:hypothetical protein